jgi:aminoglycoside 6-adenylyltransferase
VVLDLPDEASVLARVVAWGRSESAVRALVLTSGRARRDGTADALSDYDVIALMTDVTRFDAAAAYGPPLARWGDEHDVHGVRTFFRGVVYEDWVKVDWSLWPVEAAELVAEHGLTDDLDVGYRVLLDKDGLTAPWAPASYRVHIPSPPSAKDYVALIEEFWWSASYIGKSLCRGDRFFARFVLEVDLQHAVLRRMLEWLIETEHGWSVRPGAYGRGLERLLQPELAQELEGLAGSDGWDGFDRTAALFRRAATRVGDALGYEYPQRLDETASAYLDGLRTGSG